MNKKTQHRKHCFWEKNESFLETFWIHGFAHGGKRKPSSNPHDLVSNSLGPRISSCQKFDLSSLVPPMFFQFKACRNLMAKKQRFWETHFLAIPKRPFVFGLKRIIFLLCAPRDIDAFQLPFILETASDFGVFFFLEGIKGLKHTCSFQLEGACSWLSWGVRLNGTDLSIFWGYTNPPGDLDALKTWDSHLITAQSFRTKRC